MTVAEMLDRISSHELTEWQAYEMKNGPLGGGYADHMLAAVVEGLQQVAYVTGMKYKTNPVPKPKKVPRPSELAEEAKKRGDSDEPWI